VDVTAAGDWSNPAFWGEARARLLNRTRILLNLARFPGQLSGHRFLIGMGSGALVLSEPVYRPDPFVPGTHYVSAPMEGLPAVIDRLLADDEERRAIAERGRRFVCEELTMERSLGEIAALVAR